MSLNEQNYEPKKKHSYEVEDFNDIDYLVHNPNLLEKDTFTSIEEWTETTNTEHGFRLKTRVGTIENISDPDGEKTTIVIVFTAVYPLFDDIRLSPQKLLEGKKMSQSFLTSVKTKHSCTDENTLVIAFPKLPYWMEEGNYRYN